MRYKKTTLSNELRVITVPAKGNPSVTVLIATETGSNYEAKEQNGISHFLEHMVFKGTKSRVSVMDITRELDGLGSENNAFTTHEITAYHAKADKRHFKKLMEILSDMYNNPTLPAEEIEKERGVVLQEISMHDDESQYKVWEKLIELMYGNQPAGRPVIGPKANIQKFSREDLINYRNTHYIAEKTIVVVAGDLTEKAILSEVRACFKDIAKGKFIDKPKVAEEQNAPALLVHRKKSDQTHMVMAFRAFKASDKRAPALHLLSTLLGRGMSSRLFHRLREEMGACYYVRSVTDELTDHGLIGIATGIEAGRATEVVKAILEECEALTKALVSEEELNKAKEYYIGHLYMGLETTDARADFFVEQEIISGRLKSPEDIEKEIRKVSAEDVQNVARNVFQNKNLNLAIVGNVASGAPIKKVLLLREA